MCQSEKKKSRLMIIPLQFVLQLTLYQNMENFGDFFNPYGSNRIIFVALRFYDQNTSASKAVILITSTGQVTFGEISENGVVESKISSTANRILNDGKMNTLSICVNKSGNKQTIVCVLNDICTCHVELNASKQGKLPFDVTQSDTFCIFGGSGIFSAHDWFWFRLLVLREGQNCELVNHLVHIKC